MRSRITNEPPKTETPAPAAAPSGRRRLGNPAALTPEATAAVNAEFPVEVNKALEASTMEPRGSIEPTAQGNPMFDDHVQDVADRRDSARQARAAEAPKTASGLTMGHHQRIVDVLFDMPDPMEVYQRVRRALSFGGRASSMGYGGLVDALDEAETNAADAFQLLCDAKVVHDRFEIDCQVIEGTLREPAVGDLQAQKDAGTRSKAITNDDITAVMAQKFPAEYRDLSSRRSKAKRTVALLESLADLARERARDLRAMVAKSRDA